jgi:hypothetical protein
MRRVRQGTRTTKLFRDTLILEVRGGTTEPKITAVQIVVVFFRLIDLVMGGAVNWWQ